MNFPTRMVGWEPNFKWSEETPETTEISPTGKPSVDIPTSPLHHLSPAALDMRASTQVVCPHHRISPDLFSWNESSYHRQNPSINITVKAYRAKFLRQHTTQKSQQDKAAVLKARLGGDGQSGHQGVFTCIVHFSSRSEVGKPWSVNQLQAGDMFCD